MKAIIKVVDMDAIETYLSSVLAQTHREWTTKDSFRWIMSKETEKAFQGEMPNVYVNVELDGIDHLHGIKILIDDDMPFGEIELFVKGDVL